MQGMSLNKLTLVGGGCNSRIFAYGQGEDQVVLKVVSASNKKEQGHLKNQYQVLQSLHHRNVVKALRYRQNVAFQGNKTDKQLTNTTNNILVLEHASRGSLLSYLQKQKPDIGTKRRAFRSIVEGLVYLHGQGVAHRDLKLQNILVFLQDGHDIFKISDFGFAAHFQPQQTPTKFNEYKGTRKGYMAPEIHRCAQDRSQAYDPTKADVFALGVIFFALVFGHLPFEYALPTNPLFKYIIANEFPAFWTHHNSARLELEKGYRIEEMKELFQRLVSPDPERRPDVGEILKSGWLQE